MDPLATAHTAIIVAATTAAIAVFLGLAIYVAAQNLYRPTVWLFSLACLLVASLYFISFFTISGSETSLLLFLRLRWTAIIFGPTLFFHLIFFYFPLTWQYRRSQILQLVYTISFIMAAVTLLSNLVIAAPLPQDTPHVALPLPGPLMPYQVAFLFLQLLGIAISLIQSYRQTHFSSLQCHLRLLILPTVLIFVASTLHCLNIFSGETGYLPHEIPDGLLIIAAFLYLKAVIHYGSFIGRPLAWQRLLYVGLLAVGGGIAFYLTFILDNWVMIYSRFPYPPATILLVLTTAASFPKMRRWLTRYLDNRLLAQEHYQESLVQYLAKVLTTRKNNRRIPANFLEASCLILNVSCGFIIETISTETALVRAVRGPLPIHPGDTLSQPKFAATLTGAHLLLPIHLISPLEPVWAEMALICPIRLNHFNGLVVLGEKKNGLPFTAQGIDLCDKLMQQLQRYPFEVGSPSDASNPLDLPSSSNTPITEIAETLLVSHPSSPPIEIRLLGPLQVIRDGQPVPEADWGSEKAKLMLAYLLWKSPGGATREELSAVLWPARSPAEAANVFHVTLHRLRRVFQPQAQDKTAIKYIIYDRSRYRFNYAAPHQLDVTQFQTLAVCSDNAAQKAAIEQYHGPYLEDMVWALPAEVEIERRRLEQLYADALRRLAVQSDERRGSLYLEKLLTVEPADEVACQTLILNYLAQGRRDLACRQVERWQRMLAELGLDPTPETVALWETVRSNRLPQRNGNKFIT